MDAPWTCIHVTQSRKCEQLPNPQGGLVKACKRMQDLHVNPILPENDHLGPYLLRERGRISENAIASADNEVFIKVDGFVCV